MTTFSAILLLTFVAEAQEPTLQWRNLSSLPLEGSGWTKTRNIYDRLPAEAEGTVRPPVWNLALDSAGLRYRFVTDADTIHARWKLRKANLALPHMPATGVSGLDLYVRQGDRWHWLGAGRPIKQENEQVLVRGLTKQKREYLLYLPLYNGVERVEIGLAESASWEAAPDRYRGRKPIVFYGTSILQGGCASRPGMAYPSIISRAIDWPVINLGFSGNGKTEPEMAKLLAQLDPAAYVLDSLPNLSPDEARERVEPFFRVIRDAHPSTPVILVENVTYTDSAFVAARRQKAVDVNNHLRSLFEKWTGGGDRHLHYVPTSQLFGADGEDTVDGTHPTDLGFLRMAEGILPAVRAALQN
jgi:hypothetical protein